MHHGVTSVSQADIVLLLVEVTTSTAADAHSKAECNAGHIAAHLTLGNQVLASSTPVQLVTTAGAYSETDGHTQCHATAVIMQQLTARVEKGDLHRCVELIVSHVTTHRMLMITHAASR